MGHLKVLNDLLQDFPTLYVSYRGKLHKIWLVLYVTYGWTGRPYWSAGSAELLIYNVYIRLGEINRKEIADVVYFRPDIVGWVSELGSAPYR